MVAGGSSWPLRGEEFRRRPDFIDAPDESSTPTASRTGSYQRRSEGPWTRVLPFLGSRGAAPWSCGRLPVEGRGVFQGLQLGPGYLFVSLVTSSLGFSFFVYGKKQLRVPQLLAGIALMALPVFVAEPFALLAASAGTGLGLFVALRAGA